MAYCQKICKITGMGIINSLESPGGDSLSVEKAAQTNENNAKCASPKDVVSIQSEKKIQIGAIEAPEKPKVGAKKKKADLTKQNLKKKIQSYIEILAEIPSIYRDFLMLVNELDAEDFALYSIQAFKALEKDKKAIWKTQAVIAYDFHERNSIFKSKGGRNSKGQGIGAEFEKECAKIGVSSATLRDFRRVFITFVVDTTFAIPDEKERREKQMDILDGMNLRQCFYVRACAADDPFKAIKMAEEKLLITGAEYTEAEFIRDIKLQSGTSAGKAILDESSPTDASEKQEFSCQLNKKSIVYLGRQSAKWTKSVGEALDYILDMHSRLTDPREVSV